MKKFNNKIIENQFKNEKIAPKLEKTSKKMKKKSKKL